ncbi:DUF2892 domain-containing protein [Thermoflexus sp.]|uniref:YgaP family membrane protein n=1 Tax=Thermoflexus sp. TaxID=1969742 RepID=UPI0025EE0F2B|nr:DUF2892 domain-containing protein [Thermoflexus sp.]MDW8181584.1 DUF2892 domain-containing protein [Anaerolineae bacterium]MCS6965106.1 DUF2892 domain-containing protein [Thermoflexus sp.]MCS7352125.1 DUF2892 domain-containing protein [Thermoflexus sp.]MCX7691703.1 DUF2892 domain-containing protein [Thermoflexus sp.]MDW8186145.1 DUF2892 domain-containing protein [Anaerolineae bacterium]
MTLNMAGWDRIVRLIVAVVFILLSAFVLRFNTLGIILTVVGVVFILTSLIGWCPLYSLVGFRTKR